MISHLFAAAVIAFTLQTLPGKTFIVCIASLETTEPIKIKSNSAKATENDQLDVDDTVLRNFFAQPSYEESRFQLLTGQSRHPNGDKHVKSMSHGDADLTSLPQIFKESGYQTILLSNRTGQNSLPAQCAAHEWSENASHLPGAGDIDMISSMFEHADSFNDENSNKFILIDILLAGSDGSLSESAVSSFERLITAKKSTFGAMVVLPILSNPSWSGGFDKLDESLRSPCYYFRTGTLPVAKSLDILVGCNDHFPTICEIGYVNTSAIKSQINGRSILGPLLKLPFPWVDFPIVAKWSTADERLFTFRDATRRGIYSYDRCDWTIFDLRKGSNLKVNMKAGSEPWLSKIEERYGLRLRGNE